jgi:hypothetical protein
MLVLRSATLLLLLLSAVGARAEKPFGIHVVDQETGRGVPLVELKTTPNVVYITDSAGYIAIDEPLLLNRKVSFEITSHGYEFAKDGFGKPARTLECRPGAEETIKLKRINVAQRLYRITGAGIYRDSVKLGQSVPIDQPLLNSEVCGQDSTQAVVQGDRIVWLFGDTNRLSHYLGQFNTSGAISKLPKDGGLDPLLGVNLNYFAGDDGFSRPMFERENGVLIWADGAFVVHDPAGKPRVFTHYSRRKGLSEELSSGLAVLNDETNRFERVAELTMKNRPHPLGQSFEYEDAGVKYIGFANPHLHVRIPATWEAARDPGTWEAFTPLAAGSSFERKEEPQFDRDADGKIVFAWKKDAPILEQPKALELEKAGKLSAGENLLHTEGAATGKPIAFNAGTIQWNPWRKRWILISNQLFGSPSNLGEVWYAEAKRPEGPFRKAVKIVTHNNYSFYNVTQHDFFDQQAGQVILFEGTYTNQFTDKASATPWYEYNQIMYSLDLADERLKPAWVE